MQNPDNLYVYRLARALVPDVYTFIETLPPSERFNLAHQMRRSSTSIRGNICDGCGNRIARCCPSCGTLTPPPVSWSGSSSSQST